jgi:hypothetical protein
MKLRYNDDQHAYWLDGVRCKGVTTVAKIPDDLYRLQQWEKRQVAIGLATTPKLLEGVAAHLDERDMLDRLCNQAKEAAGANDGSDRGRNAHKIIERHNRGLAVVETPLSLSILAGFEEVLEAAGLEIVPEYIERFVVYPKERIAGRFDQIVRRKSDGRLVMLDYKSGLRAIDYPHSIAIQLALYANAPCMAGELNVRGETEKFEPMPELDKETAIIVALPEDGIPQAVEIDIEAGWKAAEKLCFLTLKWRSKQDLVRPLAALKPIPALRVVPTVDPDEGRDCDPKALDDLRGKVMRLPRDRRQWIIEMTDAAEAAGHSLSLKERQSVRRFDVMRGLYMLEAHDLTDLLDALVCLVLGEDTQQSIPLGAYLGTFNADQAATFAHLIDQRVIEADDQATDSVA